MTIFEWNKALGDAAYRVSTPDEVQKLKEGAKNWDTISIAFRRGKLELTRQGNPKDGKLRRWGKKFQVCVEAGNYHEARDWF